MDKNFVIQLLKTLPHLMYKLFHDLKKIESADIEMRLNKTQKKTLLILYTENNSSMTQICRMMNMEKGSFSSVVDGLINKNLVLRERDKKDRRKVHIQLTDSGSSLVENEIENIRIRLEDKLDILSSEDLKQFIWAIEVLNDITNKLQG